MFVTLPRPSPSVAVKTLAEAAAVVVADRDARNLGSAEWYEKGGAKVFEPSFADVQDARYEQIAFVSYNGRVWKGSSSNVPAEEIVL